MRLTTTLFMTGLLTSVSAHFQLQYPPPRGPFVEKDEPNFCDGYVDAVDNRTTFPTSKGIVSIFSEHPKWTLGGIMATVQNPNNFTLFRDGKGEFQQFLPFFSTTGEGAFCIDIDLASSGIDGIKDGANVTLQFVFDGGDDSLYQCADLTLSDSATIPSDVSCKNATDAATTPISTSLAAGPTSGTSSSSSAAPSNTSGSNGALRNAAIGGSGLAAVFGALVVLL